MAHAATIVASSTRLVHMVASFAGCRFKLPAGAGRQCRTPLETASERTGPPRRTTPYFDEPALEPSPELPGEPALPDAPDEPEPDEPDEPDELDEPDEPDAPAPEPLDEPSPPPAERPVTDFAAAPLVEAVGGLPEMLSFLATFFFAFFALCFGLSVVSVLSSVVVDEFAAIALGSPEPSLARLSLRVSSFARAVELSVERLDITLLPDVEVVALPVELLSILAFVPGADALLSEYDMPCGFCVFAGTVGDALALTEPDAAGATLDDDIDDDVVALTDESLGRPVSLAVEVVLAVVIEELVVVSGAFLVLW